MKDRRVHDRYPLNLTAELQREEEDKPQSVQFQNLSKGGAYFLSDSPIGIGERIEVKLGNGLYLTGEVIRVDRPFAEKFGFAVQFGQTAEGVDQLTRGKETNGNGNGHDLAEVYHLEMRELNEKAFEYYDRLERVRKYVEEHYEEDISLAAAARVAAMEKTYFSFFFKQKVGVNFSSWLQHFRISKALEMIETKNLSITDVAFSVGFNELSTFQKAFKKWTNLTPREFKRLARPA